MEERSVLTMEKKDKAIKYYLQGMTMTAIAAEIGVTRQTVSKYIKAYETIQKQIQLTQNTLEKEQLIMQASSKPKYDTSSRKRYKLTPDVEELIDLKLAENQTKLQRGQRKMMMKNIDIYEWLCDQDINISYRSVCQYIVTKQKKEQEAFIRQDYNPGEISEFDWGDVTLIIDELGGTERRFKLGVFTLKYSDRHYANLYFRENTESFTDIHVKYFEELGGVTKQVVYDNARVQVKYLAGKKQPTEAVRQLMNYYGFEARYTNPYSGNEKGHVERAVEYIRRKAFSRNNRFPTIAAAVTALHLAVQKINSRPKQRTVESADAVFARELNYLLPYRLQMDTYIQTNCKVNKYSFVHIDSNFYSVPDSYVGKELQVRKNHERIKIYDQHVLIVDTQRLVKKNDYKIDISHYLTTLKKKPGAIAHSLALKQATPWLKKTFENYYSTNPRGFVDLLTIIQKYSLQEVSYAIEENTRNNLPVENSYIIDTILKKYDATIKIQATELAIEHTCHTQLSDISNLYNQGACKWKN